jgi:hypothetical protein
MDCKHFHDMPLDNLALAYIQAGEEGSECETHQGRDFYKRLYLAIAAIGELRFPGEWLEAVEKAERLEQ